VLIEDGRRLTRAQLVEAVDAVAALLAEQGVRAGDRVMIVAENSVVQIVLMFAAAKLDAWALMSNARLSAAELDAIRAHAQPRLTAYAVDVSPDARQHAERHGAQPASRIDVDIGTWSYTLDNNAQAEPAEAARDRQCAALIYTTGTTGSPKGVMLSHRNLVAGAASVATYLSNHTGDRLIAALPLSFDAGFSQLTTAFHSGACVVLHNYLLAQDLLKVIAREKITGLTAVPPLYMQLVQQRWPENLDEHLRYFANTGGRMPLATLQKLRAALPRSKPYLMYGLTEAFRSTYLPPEQVDTRPDSIGKAIPNAEVLVLRPDGSECAADEPGELVHRGPLVGLGYWNDPATTAQRFKPLPRVAGQTLDEVAVFSGDTVRRDKEGYLYFIGRKDEMIKTSGYRVSPSEIEEAVHATGLVVECCAYGVEDETLGQRIQLAAVAASASPLEPGELLQACRTRLPAYMLPVQIFIRSAPLPRNANGKIDRLVVADEATGSIR